MTVFAFDTLQLYAINELDKENLGVCLEKNVVLLWEVLILILPYIVHSDCMHDSVNHTKVLCKTRFCKPTCFT